MKLLRYGPAGREKPGMLDATGGIRDLSAIVAEIGWNEISPAGLRKLAKIKPECQLVAELQRRRPLPSVVDQRRSETQRYLWRGNSRH